MEKISDRPSKASQEDVLVRFASNLLRHITVVASVLNRRLVLVCAKEGYEELRPSYIQILLQLGSAGRRTADISHYCGLAKQVVGLFADDLERQGYLIRKVDPQDGRAKLLFATRRGLKLIAFLDQATQQVEDELAALVGSDAFEEFKAACTQLLHAQLPAGQEGGTERKSAPIPLSLAALATHCERTLMELDKTKGYRQLKMSFTQVLMYTSPHGTLINELARINGVSKQAISQIVSQIEELGYVHRQQHPGDARSSIIYLTDMGLQLISDSLNNIVDIESSFIRILGSRGQKRFVASAEQLFFCLNTGNENTDLGTEALLRRVMERLYQESEESQRSRLFICGAGKAKFSGNVLKILENLEIRVEYGVFGAGKFDTDKVLADW